MNISEQGRFCGLFFIFYKSSLGKLKVVDHFRFQKLKQKYNINSSLKKTYTLSQYVLIDQFKENVQG